MAGEDFKPGELTEEALAVIEALEALDPIHYGERVLTIKYEAGCRVRISHRAERTFLPQKPTN